MLNSLLLAGIFIIVVVAFCVAENYPLLCSMRIGAQNKLTYMNAMHVQTSASSMGNTLNSRIYTTILKGVAIILVLICHFSGNMSRVFTPFGGIGVAMFLVLSGYGFNESYKKNGLHKFWSKRFIRLWIPYAIVICALILIEKHPIIWLINNITLYQCPFWFIKYIILWYLLFWGVSRFARKYRIQIIIFVGFVLLFVTSGVRGEQALSFPLGVVLSEMKIRLEFNKLKIPPTVLFGLLIIGVAFLSLKQTHWYRTIESDILINLLNLPIKLGLGLFLIFTLSKISFLYNNKFLMFTGVISYELYMVHYPFRGLAGVNLPLAFLLVIVSYLLSYMLYRLDNLLSNRVNRFFNRL